MLIVNDIRLFRVAMDTLSLEDKPKPIQTEPLIQAQESVSSQNVEASILSPTPVHNTQPQQTASEAGALSDPQAQVVKQKEKSAQVETSDTDPDEPVAKQMLSFIMDDPDFESEEEVIQKVNKVLMWSWWWWALGLWRYWIFPYRGEAATNIAVCRLIARPPPPPPPPVKKNWRGHTCASLRLHAAEPQHIVAGVRFHWSREEMQF